MNRATLTLFGAATVVLVATVLSGCASKSPALPSPNASEQAQSTATPAPDPLAAPAPRLSLTCDELVPSAVRASFLGVAADDIEPNAGYRMAADRATYRAAGAVSCSWNGPVLGEDLGLMLHVEVLPEASAQYASRSVWSGPSDQVGSISPESSVQCGDDQAAFNCTVEFEFQEAWVHIEATGMAVSDSFAAATKFSQSVIAALGGAPALGPRYVAPPGALGVDITCADIDAAGAFRVALASPNLGEPLGDPTIDSQYPYIFVSGVSEKAGRQSCSWNTADWSTIPAGGVKSVGLSVLPGGAWAWDDVLAERMAFDSWSETEVAGSEKAMTSTMMPGMCSVTAVIDMSLVDVTVEQEEVSGEDPCATVATVISLVKATT